jgi:hypothetical protein
MKRLFAILLITASISISAQTGVGINTVTPEASSALDISSTSKGLLIPRMNEAQRTGINPSQSANGLLVYQTDGTSGFYYYNGTQWNRLEGVQGPPGAPGTPGTPGLEGIEGVPGSDGLDGAQGAQGSTGENGADGADGANGINGTNGSDGLNGTNGANGANGANGSDGLDGTDGAGGADGVDGADGAGGVDGADGADGADGVDGVDGVDGAVGLTGATGATGWGLAGNLGTTSGTDFIGTTDAQNLEIRTNNVLHHRFTQQGQLEFLNTGNSVFIGEGAGANFTSAQYNTAIGRNALYATTGSNNTALGALAGGSNVTGSNNTYLGYNVSTVNNLTNATAIGANTSLTQSNTVILGNNSDVGIGISDPTSKLHIKGGHLRHEGQQPAGTNVGSSDMRGAVNVNFAATGAITVVFTEMFTTVPTVIITPVCTADPSVNSRYWVSNVSLTGFMVVWSNTTSTSSINYMVIE